MYVSGFVQGVRDSLEKIDDPEVRASILKEILKGRTPEVQAEMQLCFELEEQQKVHRAVVKEVESGIVSFAAGRVIHEGRPEAFTFARPPSKDTA